MEKVALEISESLQKMFGSQVKAILARQGSKALEITILARTDDNDSLRAEAYSLAKAKSRLEIDVCQPEEFFEKVLDNDANALEMLRLSEICLDNNFIAPLKALAESGKVFRHNHALEVTAKAQSRLAKIENLKQESARKLFNSIFMSANAALSARGYSISTDSELPSHLRECFVKNDLLEKKYVEACERILDAYNRVNENRQFELSEFSGLSKDAEMFVERMKTFIR